MGLKYYKLCFETMTQGMFAMTPCTVVCDLAHVWKPQFLDCRTAHCLGISKAAINWNVSLYNCVCVSSSFVLLQVAAVQAGKRRTGENLLPLILRGCGGNSNCDSHPPCLEFIYLANQVQSWQEIIFATVKLFLWGWSSFLWGQWKVLRRLRWESEQLDVGSAGSSSLKTGAKASVPSWSSFWTRNCKMDEKTHRTVFETLCYGWGIPSPLCLGRIFYSVIT